MAVNLKSDTSNSYLLWGLCAAHCALLSLFLASFIPVTEQPTGYATHDSLPKDVDGLRLDVADLYGARADRLVLLVVDALRADQVMGEQRRQHMPYVDELHVQARACTYPARAHTPTVTLPRIKALVSGAVPDFGDVVRNAGGAHAMAGLDSVVHQATAAGLSAVFYGDDTWLRLFPDHFLRSDGTTSFFVNDYTEVDANVTRHLDDELARTDWTVMILHYLGLDHIGHTAGPKSPLVAAKLREMDAVVERIHRQSLQDAGRTVLILCGDHGMSDAGSHGGASPAETDVSFTFVLDGCVAPKEGAPAALQIDLAATISLLLGLPPPASSLGIVLDGVADAASLRLTPARRLYAAYADARRLADHWRRRFAASASDAGDDPDDAEYRLYRRAVGLYRRLVEGGGNAETQPEPVLRLLRAAGEALSRRLAAPDDSFNEPAMAATAGLALLLLVVVSHRCLNAFTSPWTLLEVFLVAASLGHALSLASSSFVEEEHQTAYLVSSTLILLLLVTDKDGDRWMRLRLVAALALARLGRAWNATGDKWAHLADVEDWLTDAGRRPLLTAAAAASAAGIFDWTRRRQRRWRLRPAQRAALAVGLAAAVAHRSAVGVLTPVLATSSGRAEALTAYAAALFIVGVALYWRQEGGGGLVSAWLVLTSLLKRAHNLPLTLLHLWQYALLRPTLRRRLNADAGAGFAWGLAHHWLAAAWYFQQGNGNSLARVDLSAGYVGLSDHQTALVALLLAAATYSAPVLGLLLALQGSAQEGKDGVRWAFVWGRCLVGGVYPAVVSAVRHHLFVWSVFSPKLLYEVVHSTFLSLALVLVSVTFRSAPAKSTKCV